MTDPGSVAIALIAAIWARETARSAAFERLNSIREKIIGRRREAEGWPKDYPRLMYEADWAPIAFGIVTTTFLFAAVIAALPFLVDAEGTSIVVAVCATVALYQICSGIFTASTLLRDARYLRAQLREMEDEASTC